MSSELAVADWPAITDNDVRRLFARLGATREVGSRLIHVTWHSPRPMSAAALVACGEREYFVKRHHVTVRSWERLHVEHAFVRHLGERGQPVAPVLDDGAGETVLRDGDVLYEVHEKAPGIDLYREVPSWYPFESIAHARAAGIALARFHTAAADFPAPATPPQVLMDSMAVTAAQDPLAALRQLVASRPALGRAVERRTFDIDVAREVHPLMATAAPLLRGLTTQWTHGDWHPSNLTWTSREADASVAGILDVGLSNRTVVVRDIALAIERSAIDWLGVVDPKEIRADLEIVAALLDGYEMERPLGRDERAALVAILPVVHLEFALSEVEYFFDVVHSSANTDLAYDAYFIGHARWFREREGAGLLEYLRDR